MLQSTPSKRLSQIKSIRKPAHFQRSLLYFILLYKAKKEGLQYVIHCPSWKIRELLKLFHEIIIQIGDRESCGAATEDDRLKDRIYETTIAIAMPEESIRSLHADRDKEAFLRSRGIA